MPSRYPRPRTEHPMRLEYPLSMLPGAPSTQRRRSVPRQCLRPDRPAQPQPLPYPTGPAQPPRPPALGLRRIRKRPHEHHSRRWRPCAERLRHRHPMGTNSFAATISIRRNHAALFHDHRSRFRHRQTPGPARSHTAIDHPGMGRAPTGHRRRTYHRRSPRQTHTANCRAPSNDHPRVLPRCYRNRPRSVGDHRLLKETDMRPQDEHKPLSRAFGPVPQDYRRVFPPPPKNSASNEIDDGD